MKRLFYILLGVLMLLSSCKEAPEYARFNDDTYYVGTNFWYGAILASQGQGGDRQRLSRELDQLQSIGVNNLRVLVGSDGLHSRE